jgi:hypothetical protein
MVYYHQVQENDINFLSFIVSNMRMEFHFDDLADPQKMPDGVGSPDDWCLGFSDFSKTPDAVHWH